MNTTRPTYIMWNDHRRKVCASCGQPIKQAERFTRPTPDTVAHQGRCTTDAEELRARLAGNRTSLADLAPYNGTAPGASAIANVRRDCELVCRELARRGVTVEHTCHGDIFCGTPTGVAVGACLACLGGVA